MFMIKVRGLYWEKRRRPRTEHIGIPTFKGRKWQGDWDSRADKEKPGEHETMEIRRYRSGSESDDWQCCKVINWSAPSSAGEWSSKLRMKHIH